jgi:ubiquinone/menaquinone biosynthesis C-methylase UbiE
MRTFNKIQVPSYGYYCFKPYMVMLSLFLVLGLGIGFFGIKLNRTLFFSLGVGLIIYGILTTLGWVLARYVIPGNRMKIARKVIKDIRLSGSEFVLDVGSGRGLFAIETAKVLTTGRVVGIDIWDPENISNLCHHHKLSKPTGNTIFNAKRNSEIEGVAEKVSFINMDGNSTQFDSETFDVVVCAFVVGHQGEYGINMLKEMNRVLKPGGKLIVIDSFRDLTYLLLATPHLFVVSYLRGTKAKRLTKKNWKLWIGAAGFSIQRFEAKRSIMVVEGEK